MKKALITGITGQDGVYLSQFLLKNGYKVYGLIPRRKTPDYEGLDYLGIRDEVSLVGGDLMDLSSLIYAIESCEPDEVYNLGAQSFVGSSWTQPLLTAEITGLGCLRVLEAVKIVNKKIRFYQASTSEMYGSIQQPIQSEQTPFHPRSPYGFSKLLAHWATVNYRESFNMFACTGILFNHESPLRGIEFVTRKVSDGVARIKLKHQKKIHLGNLDPERDWGFAGDYVEGMWMILNHKEPSDFVLATEKTWSVRDLCRVAFDYVGLNYEDHVVSEKRLFRPAEINILQGDATKAHKILGWKHKTSFEDLIAMMVEADLKRVRVSIAHGE